MAPASSSAAPSSPGQVSTVPGTPSPAAGSSGTPSATSFGGDPTVGALFSGGLDGGHSCSASVVDSPGADLVLTAAHCVAGTGAGLEFVPGYADGTAPHGVWAVTAAYADPSWLSAQDPAHDYAVLRIAHQMIDRRSLGVEDVVGAHSLGPAPAPGAPVTVDGYAAGADDLPVSCSSTVELTGAYPTFVCHGFVDGTSGGPWLQGAGASTQLVGVIGGLNQGGCTEGTSYSAPFDADTAALLQRAAAGLDPDTLPAAGTSGCT